MDGWPAGVLHIYLIWIRNELTVGHAICNIEIFAAGDSSRWRYPEIKTRIFSYGLAAKMMPQYQCFRYRFEMPTIIIYFTHISIAASYGA